ncbi:hypothetical protein U1Q18_017254 [Sarracenia purpurea var. burkii]
MVIHLAGPSMILLTLLSRDYRGYSENFSKILFHDNMITVLEKAKISYASFHNPCAIFNGLLCPSFGAALQFAATEYLEDLVCLGCAWPWYCPV